MNRRRFIRLTAVGAALPIAGSLIGAAHAQAGTKVSETNPQAAALQYRVDATKAPARKDPTHFCDNCALYTGKPGAAEGPCSLFAGGLVAAKGWCTAWAKKA
jgi:outer membrane murein-binding lipoprotein Lpp